VASPGRGLQPNYRNQLIGKVAKRNMKVGDFFYPSDLEEGSVEHRHYSFKRPWGFPVRYHDHKELFETSNPNFLEFHLSYKDMELPIEQFFNTQDGVYKNTDLVVHSPDTFTGDHLLNLAAENEEYRARSVAELQRVINLTRAIGVYFKKRERIPIVASLGGFTTDAPATEEEKQLMYARVAESLAKLDTTGVEILPQTLPPFPWYFGGQMHLNIFVAPKDTVEFCKKHNYRICLDISHTKLAANHFGWPFDEVIEQLGPHIAHLHIVDAKGLDGEGLQVGDGEVDFKTLAKQLARLAPNASFIPEIWQGHENRGEGFHIALQKLERWF